MQGGGGVERNVTAVKQNPSGNFWGKGKQWSHPLFCGATLRKEKEKPEILKHGEKPFWKEAFLQKARQKSQFHQTKGKRRKVQLAGRRGESL